MSTLRDVAIEDCFPMLWDDPAELTVARSLDDSDEVTAAVEEATWILWMLTGQRFTSDFTARTDIYRYRPIEKLRLAHGPVAKIFNATRINPATDEEVLHTGWVDLRGGVMRLNSRQGAIPQLGQKMCGSDNPDTLLSVTYLTKPNLPAGAARATRKLAYELYLANRGQPCALPDRVTNVTRQGVSWTLLDPMTFLNDKLTGLGSVDQWISAAINRGYGGIRDTLTWLELVESEVIGCGEDFEP